MSESVERGRFVVEGIDDQVGHPELAAMLLRGAAQLQRFLRIFPSKIDEYEAILTSNEVFRNRTIGVGMIPPEVARAYSVTGPILRASGVDYDVRRAEPYSIYDRFDWDVPVRYNGDCFDRYMMRVLEMRQSTRILQQALDSIPEGDIRAKMPKVLKPPKGTHRAARN